ncbi:uncharacterized protein LOC133364330 [Rhineura floridana]|uniref:uncharacterized protein LOC133364330 n=1 Tax=Rhineura floridana TaxID=261503 RepID=UPI002AC87BC6|nr:uncharacterized protein LOC133364330 [Rhineura floridana]
MVTLDFITDLPASQRKTSVLVIMNAFTIIAINGEGGTLPPIDLRALIKDVATCPYTPHSSPVQETCSKAAACSQASLRHGARSCDRGRAILAPTSESEAWLAKCYGDGLMSQYIKSWKEGDSVFWRGPFGGFPYTANQYGELLMLASGTGLAPMLPTLQHVTENEDDETFVTLVGCFKNFENIYMKSLLQEQSRFWNVRAFYVLSQEAAAAGNQNPPQPALSAPCCHKREETP